MAYMATSSQGCFHGLDCGYHRGGRDFVKMPLPTSCQKRLQLSKNAYQLLHVKGVDQSASYNPHRGAHGARVDGSSELTGRMKPPFKRSSMVGGLLMAAWMCRTSRHSVP
eukprot:scaffold3964_cov67-Phaeocystis_antarctica.AAC.4